MHPYYRVLMFIRKVKKSNGRNNTKYEYLQIVESVRTEKGPRQRLLLNLGPLPIRPEQYSALICRIEEILTGQKCFEEPDETIERYARDAAKNIYRKKSTDTEAADIEAYELVNTQSIEVKEPRSLGAEHVCHEVWKELGLSDFLKDRGVGESMLAVIEAIVIGRLVEPASERHTQDWAEKRSAVYELIGYPARITEHSYYRAGDVILKHKDELEKHLVKTECGLFDLSDKIILFDLTNSYFEGQAKANLKAQFGRSKEKRSDARLLTLALIVDSLGFAKYSELFAGNQSEPKTLVDMIAKLESTLPAKEEKRTVVIDAGIATQENIEWLTNNGYHYIAVNRGGAPFEMNFDNMTVLRDDPQKGIKIEVKRVIVNEEVYILTRSERKAAKESAMLSRVEKLFIEKLENQKKMAQNPDRSRLYFKIVESIGRLKEKYPKVAKLYSIEVIAADDDVSDIKKKKVKDVVWEKKSDEYDSEVEEHGTYVLRSNRFDLSDAEIWETYIMLNRIENAFRCLKSSLGFRPVFHQTESRSDAHLFISVLAYHILRIIEHRLRLKGDHRSWATVRDCLSTHGRVTVSYKMKDKDGQVVNRSTRLSTEPELEHDEIYRRLGIPTKPLPRRVLEKSL
jgi:transposase